VMAIANTRMCCSIGIPLAYIRYRKVPDADDNLIAKTGNSLSHTENHLV
jgi:hypothetical protein